jgi:cytochrome c6
MKIKLLTIVLILLTWGAIAFNPPALAVDTINGAKIFNANCAGCHVNGSNIVRRGKNLKQKTLHRNHLDSIDAIATLVSNGKNNMSAYKDRLSPQQIEDVAAYVLEQAQKDW